MSDNDEHLEHYGVKGMQWGVRRKRGSDGRVDDTKRKGKGKNQTRTTFQKTPNRLSDVELQKRIRRMELEKKYNDLNSPQISKGKKFASEVITNSSKASIATVTAFAVKTALKKKFGGETKE